MPVQPRRQQPPLGVVRGETEGGAVRLAGPVVRLNQAVAHAQVGDPVDALRRLEGLGADLAGYHLFHAVRAELLTTLGRHDEAREANRTALGLTSNDAERRLLTTRLHRHPLQDGT